MFYIIISVVLVIIGFGLFKKIPVFDCFLSGAKCGLSTMFSLAPTLIGIVAAVNMLKASGLLEALSVFLSPLCGALGVPKEVIPMALLRPVSGSGSAAILTSIFRDFSPDSIVGQIASVMSGSTETTFYAVTVYYSSVGITKTRHTLFCALFADVVAAVLSVLTVRLILY